MIEEMEEALEDYYKTLLPGAASYGRTIWRNDTYVGDIWCYCIDPSGEPNAMISYCIFDSAFVGLGIATQALKLFTNHPEIPTEISGRFYLRFQCPLYPGIGEKSF